jgi:hypothetical protein
VHPTFFPRRSARVGALTMGWFHAWCVSPRRSVACLWQARHPVFAHWQEGPEHDCFRIDRGVTRYAIRGDRHALESDGRSSTPQSTKGRAFHDEIRPNRRNRCALLISSRSNAPIQGEVGLVSEPSGFIGMLLCPEYLCQKVAPAIVTIF